ncbi:MAG: YfhH family protein [Ectobacillus sp.]
MNIPKRYSEMTEHELRQEIGMLKEKAAKAEQLGMVNECEVLARKIAMARAYMMDMNDFQVGETYGLTEEPGVSFTITYFNGVFAWGYRGNNKEEEIGIPISLLEKREKQ